jgi:hypothetical protein
MESMKESGHVQCYLNLICSKCPSIHTAEGCVVNVKPDMGPKTKPPAEWAVLTNIVSGARNL